MQSRRYLSITQIEDMVQSHQLLRVLRPDFQKRLQSQMNRNPYLFENRGQLYISLEHIDDPAYRARVYRRIQAHLVGTKQDLRDLPDELYRLLQPGLTTQAQWLGVFLISGVVGVVLGVLGMSLGLMFMSMVEVSFSMSLQNGLVLPITNIMFVGFMLLGWGITAALLFARHRFPFLQRGRI